MLRHVDDIAEERSGTPGARGWKNGRCASVKEIGDLTGRKSGCERKGEREKGMCTSERDRRAVGEKENDEARCME